MSGETQGPVQEMRMDSEQEPSEACSGRDEREQDSYCISAYSRILEMGITLDV